ncbi:hypothetical protein ACFU8W_32215 [Streptomyces sp. NPDC057565]
MEDAAGDEPFVLRPSLAVVAQGEAARVGEQLANAFAGAAEINVGGRPA